MKEIKKNEQGFYGIVENDNVVVPFKYYKIDIIPIYEDLFVATLNSGIVNKKGIFVRNRVVINSKDEVLIYVNAGCGIDYNDNKIAITYDQEYLDNVIKPKKKLTFHQRRIDF
ncbi:MAG: hypothetical protein J5892_02270 [Bacilli bacterium]|nr:hypothetical protein [Bacilli bacterium]